jgi:hypothetical protein
VRGVSVVLYVVAVVLFVLVGLGVELGAFGRVDLLAFGLAAFAAAHVVP